MITYKYNYYCFDDDCTRYAKMQHIIKTDDKENNVELCGECSNELKLVGKSTNMMYNGVGDKWTNK